MTDIDSPLSLYLLYLACFLHAKTPLASFLLLEIVRTPSLFTMLILVEWYGLW